MPDITITLTPQQVARVRSALGVNTADEVSEILRAYLRDRVMAEELAETRADAVTRAKATIAGEGWDN